MGFLDKVKQTAGEVGAEMKKGADQLKEKVDETQLRRKGDDLARQLGYLIYKERVKGQAAGEEAGELVAQMQEVEKQLKEGEQS